MDPKHERRRDRRGYTVKVTRIGRFWGVRVFQGEEIVSQGSIERKGLIRAEIREQLRWLDKLGHVSPMAHASRHRP